MSRWSFPIAFVAAFVNDLATSPTGHYVHWRCHRKCTRSSIVCCRGLPHLWICVSMQLELHEANQGDFVPLTGKQHDLHSLKRLASSTEIPRIRTGHCCAASSLENAPRLLLVVHLVVFNAPKSGVCVKERALHRIPILTGDKFGPSWGGGSAWP